MDEGGAGISKSPGRGRDREQEATTQGESNQTKATKNSRSRETFIEVYERCVARYEKQTALLFVSPEPIRQRACLARRWRHCRVNPVGCQTVTAEILRLTQILRVNDMGKTKKSVVRKADRPRGKQKKRDVAAWGTPPAQRALRKLTDLAAKHERGFQRELEAILKAVGAIDREVASRAVSVLGRSAAARWLASRNITLGSTTPLCALAEGHRDQVLAVLGRIEHGIGA